RQRHFLQERIDGSTVLEVCHRPLFQSLEAGVAIESVVGGTEPLLERGSRHLFVRAGGPARRHRRQGGEAHGGQQGSCHSLHVDPTSSVGFAAEAGSSGSVTT